eukprot:1143517-Pelagomonas_calceolata.AAC.1
MPRNDRESGYGLMRSLDEGSYQGARAESEVGMHRQSDHSSRFCFKGQLRSLEEARAANLSAQDVNMLHFFRMEGQDT